MTKHIEEHCSTDKCPRCAAVYAMLQRFQIRQSLPRYSELFQLVEHAVELEEAIFEYRLRNPPTVLVGDANFDLLSEKLKDASKHISMGCKVEEPPCSICDGTEKEPLMLEVPLPPPGQPNANGDVFPGGVLIVKGTEVRHEDKVVAHIIRVDENKVVVEFERSEEDKYFQQRVLKGLAVLPEFCDVQENHEVHVGIFEVPPKNGLPGIVGIRVNNSGIPVMFDVTTDSGNHLRVLRHAKYVIEAILKGTNDVKGTDDD